MEWNIAMFIFIAKPFMWYLFIFNDRHYNSRIYHDFFENLPCLYKHIDHISPMWEKRVIFYAYLKLDIV